MTRTASQVGILVVDDDKEICDYLEILLMQEGFRAKTLTNPQDALDMVRSGRFHIVILDLMMPRLDGIELLRQIRNVDSDIAVLILTGYPSLTTAVQAIKLDAVDYINKPFTPNELRNALDRIIKLKGLSRNPEEELHRTIGNTIRALRKEHGLTLKQMARRTSLSVSLLSQIERAESSASISSLFSIAAALDTKFTSLFKGY